MAADELTVKLASGVVRGRRDGEARAFLGLPYAAPPVGPGRWRPPQPVAAWEDVRPADQFGPVCPQPPFPSLPRYAFTVSSEDCLNLNVWAPRDAHAAPVLFVIHGGGFRIGSGSQTSFNGAVLAEAGVVVVTINYRLGSFGFYGGAFWLMDQIAALRWVQDNIEAFGGDPGRVTIFGCSAGGVSVNTLNLSPAARGLFNQAICLSGGADLMYAPADAPSSVDEAALERRRSIPTADLVPPTAFPGGVGERPVVDGNLIPCLPSAAPTQGRLNAGRIIYGASDFKGSGLDAMDIASAVTVERLEPTGLARAYEGLERDALGYALYGDVVFRAPASQLAVLAAEAGVETYLFDYAYVPSALRGAVSGAAHCAPAWAMLGTHAGAYGSLGVASEAADETAAERFRGRMIAFLHGRAPDVEGEERWPRVESAPPVALCAGRDGGVRVRPLPDAERLSAAVLAFG